MRPGGRGRPRLRLGERGLLQPPSPPNRRLLPRAQQLPLLLLALAVASAFYTIWSGWHRGTEELPPGRQLRVRPGGATPGVLLPLLPLPKVSGGRGFIARPSCRCHGCGLQDARPLFMERGFRLAL